MLQSGCVGSVTSASAGITFAHELSGVAPGRALPGGTVRVYGSTIAAGVPVTVLVDDDPATTASRGSVTVTPSAAGVVTFDLPADMAPGTYYAAIAADASGPGQSEWRQALEVVAATADIANEEDPSCGGAGTECAHLIAPGQTLTGTWGEAGDVDYYAFTAGAGTTFDVAVERADTSLSPLHPDAVDPGGVRRRPRRALRRRPRRRHRRLRGRHRRPSHRLRGARSRGCTCSRAAASRAPGSTASP